MRSVAVAVAAVLGAVLAVGGVGGAAVAASPSPGPVASVAPDAGCVTDAVVSGPLLFGIVDGSLPQVVGWSTGFVLGASSPSWQVVAPGRRARLQVLAWPEYAIRGFAVGLASPAAPGDAAVWAQGLGVELMGDTNVRLGDGIDRPAFLVQGPTGKDDAEQAGILAIWTIGDTSIAVEALADAACLPVAEPMLRSLLAQVQPPTRRLVPLPTMPVIEVEGSFAP